MKKRFPTLGHMEEAGIITENERKIIEGLDEKCIQMEFEEPEPEEEENKNPSVTQFFVPVSKSKGMCQSVNLQKNLWHL